MNDSKIVEGAIAPAFTLADTHGVKVKLSEFKGQYVVIYFYPKDDTPGCTKEACGFRDLSKEFEQLNAVVLGISPDEGPSHEKFIKKYDIPFTLLCDPNKSVMEKYAAWGEKNMYGKITIGTIRSTVLVGPDGKIIKHWKKVTKADQHPSKVKEVIEKHQHA